MEEIVRKIELAFNDTPYPGDEHIVFNDDPEAQEIKDAFKGRKWQNVPFKILKEQNEAMFFFSKEGYRYYLPAYLLLCLRCPVKLDIIPESLLFSLLNPPLEGPEQWAHGSRLDIFSRAEQSAILMWLEYMKESGPEAYEGYEYERAIRIIDDSRGSSI